MFVLWPNYDCLPKLRIIGSIEFVLQRLKVTSMTVVSMVHSCRSTYTFWALDKYQCVSQKSYFNEKFLTFCLSKMIFNKLCCEITPYVRSRFLRECTTKRVMSPDFPEVHDLSKQQLFVETCLAKFKYTYMCRRV